MKAADRCKQHFKGDKCRLSEGHSGNHISPLHEFDERGKRVGNGQTNQNEPKGK